MNFNFFITYSIGNQVLTQFKFNWSAITDKMTILIPKYKDKQLQEQNDIREHGLIEWCCLQGQWTMYKGDCYFSDRGLGMNLCILFFVQRK